MVRSKAKKSSEQSSSDEKQNVLKEKEKKTQLWI